MEQSRSSSPHLAEDEATHRFGEFELDLRARELRRTGRPLNLTRKTLLVLVYLVRNRGRVVLRAELMDALWPNIHVAEGSLNQAIWEIRKALQEPSKGPRIIQTLRGRGYRFAAHVETQFPPRPPQPGELAPLRVPDCWPARLAERMQRLTQEDLAIVVELAAVLAQASEAPREARAGQSHRGGA